MFCGVFFLFFSFCGVFFFYFGYFFFFFSVLVFASEPYEALSKVKWVCLKLIAILKVKLQSN